MSTIKFYLKGLKKDTPEDEHLKIYVRYQMGRKVDFRASIKKSVLVNDWNIEKEKTKNRTHLNNSPINELVSNIRNHFDKYDKDNIKIGYTPSYTEVKEHYNNFYTESKEAPTKHTLLTFINEFIQASETKGKVTKGTIKTYYTTYNALIDFNDNEYKIDFDSINLDFYNDFVEWCESKLLSLNYIGKHIKTLKTFLNNAVESGHTENLQYKSKRFKVLKEDSENVALSIDELSLLQKLDLSKDSKLETIRDLFLLGAYTGLRISDFNNLSKDSITSVEGIRVIKIRTKKTDQGVVIPLHPIVEEILKKNNGNLPKHISDTKINKHIKDLCESAGIDNIEHVTKTKGGKKITSKKYKYELVSSHTARRSFCTNAYFAEVPPIDIMTISGHKTEQAFLTYIKRTPEQTAIKMSEHPFFQNNNKLKIVI